MNFHGQTVNFALYGEAACGLLVPHIVFERERKKHRNVTGVEACDDFASTWLAHYPKPKTVVTDPEGAFQSTVFRENLSSLVIEYSPTAGDAHHQLGWLERAIQTVKRIAERLASEFPQATAIQILAAACAVQ